MPLVLTFNAFFLLAESLDTTYPALLIVTRDVLCIPLEEVVVDEEAARTCAGPFPVLRNKTSMSNSHTTSSAFCFRFISGLLFDSTNNVIGIHLDMIWLAITCMMVLLIQKVPLLHRHVRV